MGLIRLGWTYLRLGAINELQYGANFLIQLVQSLLAVATGLAGLRVVLRYTDSLGGWTPPELLAVMGIHLLMSALIQMVIQPNMERIIADVHLGTLDYVLAKPVDSQFHVSVREFRIWQAVDAIVALTVLAVAGAQLGATIGVLQVLSFLGMLSLGGLVVYSLWLMLATSAFWLVRTGRLLEVFNSIFQAARWPVSIYPQWLRFSLTYLVPVAFAVTVPAEALTSRMTVPAALTAALLACALFAASRRLWELGLRQYRGASA